MKSMTRKQFQAAVEAGISAAIPEMPLSEQQLLRHVAATSTCVTVGSFFYGYGCPLTQAGLVSKALLLQDGYEMPSYFGKFYATFDCSVPFLHGFAADVQIVEFS